MLATSRARWSKFNLVLPRAHPSSVELGRLKREAGEGYDPRNEIIIDSAAEKGERAPGGFSRVRRRVSGPSWSCAWFGKVLALRDGSREDVRFKVPK